jgi:hypothetical protein
MMADHNLALGLRTAICRGSLSVLLDELTGLSLPAISNNLRIPTNRLEPTNSEILRLPSLRSSRSWRFGTG